MRSLVLGQTRTDSTRDVLLLLARVVVGVVLIAHGKQKLDMGLSGVAAMFDQMGVPAATAAAVFAIGAELVGGALLLLGLLSPVAGAWIALDMAGAFWFAHKGMGLWVTDGGWELVAVIGAAALALGLLPGRLSVDHLIGRRADV